MHVFFAECVPAYRTSIFGTVPIQWKSK